MEYKLDTDVAKFEIHQEPHGLWDLWVDGMPTLTFESPEEAARSVYNKHTGYVIWDQLDEHDAPEDINGWIKYE
ncbi:MAG: hypothetical protein R8G33_07200 [Gammaproteobacteria bacterium]|nr:hypothetical protein [Gammaproteobacteria bacterium]